MLPPAGQIFEKMTPPLFFLMIFRTFLECSSRVIAGVLPPAGQIFEKWHLLKMFDDFPNFA